MCVCVCLQGLQLFISVWPTLSLLPGPVYWLAPSNGVSLCLPGRDQSLCRMCVSAATWPAPRCARPGYTMIILDGDVRAGSEGSYRKRKRNKVVTRSNTPSISVNHYPLEHHW